MASSFENDSGDLVPWAVDEIAEVWNQYKPARWKKFSAGTSAKTKSAYRLTCLLRENAQWLDCSKKSDIDDLFQQFRTYLLIALSTIEKEDSQRLEELLGSQYQLNLDFWQFCRDLKNVHLLAQRGLGNDEAVAVVTDLDRRRAKARLLSDFDKSMKSFIKKVAYVSGSGPDSNRRLEQALELANQALIQAEQDLEWSEG